MNKQFALAAALALLLGARAAWAHEGHLHKVMGTVTRVNKNRVEVKGTDGKIATIIVDDKTKVVRGKSEVRPTDINAGDRVVVTAKESKDKGGKVTRTATTVQLGTAPKTTAKE